MIQKKTLSHRISLVLSPAHHTQYLGHLENVLKTDTGSVLGVSQQAYGYNND